MHSGLPATEVQGATQSAADMITAACLPHLPVLGNPHPNCCLSNVTPLVCLRPYNDTDTLTWMVSNDVCAQEEAAIIASHLVWSSNLVTLTQGLLPSTHCYLRVTSPPWSHQEWLLF